MRCQSRVPTSTGEAEILGEKYSIDVLPPFFLTLAFKYLLAVFQDLFFLAGNPLYKSRLHRTDLLSTGVLFEFLFCLHRRPAPGTLNRSQVYAIEMLPICLVISLSAFRGRVVKPYFIFEVDNHPGPPHALNLRAISWP